LQKFPGGVRPVVRTGPGLPSKFGRRSFGGKSVYRQQFRPSGQVRPGDVSSAGYLSPTAPSSTQATNQSPADPAASTPAVRSEAEDRRAQSQPPLDQTDWTRASNGNPATAGSTDNSAASSLDSDTASDESANSNELRPSENPGLPQPQESSAAHADAAPAESPPTSSHRKTGRRGRIMLVNAADTDECRIAMLSQGILEEFYIERGSNDLHVGNIYKGRVTNVEPAIQAAFIDFGINKNGFLHISDLHPQYFPRHLQQRWHKTTLNASRTPSPGAPATDAAQPAADGTSSEPAADESEGQPESDEMVDLLLVENDHIAPMEKVGRKTPRSSRPPIQQCLRRGQEIIVQVTKEGIGTKGPSLTSYISVPGRYLVMMPGMSQLGVSRKVVDDQQRREMKQLLQEINPPKNLGFIIRTAGADKSAEELKADLLQLLARWRDISHRIETQPSPALLYEESDLLTRTMRDLDLDGIERVIVDNPTMLDRIGAFIASVEPDSKRSLELFTESTPLFSRYGVERELEKINSRRVEMANGGSLVFDSTEALVAVDVNSGRYREHRDAEMTAFKVNQEAVREICRQLKLRDLGGVIVIDFIDMRDERHKREIEHMLREELKKDRAKTKVLRMSQFCMVELTRQRMKPSLKRSIYMDCPHCHGAGLIKNPESVSLDVLRRIAAAAMHAKVAVLEVRVYTAVADYLLNKKRRELLAAEDKTNRKINIIADEQAAGDSVVITATDARGVDLRLEL
jgi:ribonuclease E